MNSKYLNIKNTKIIIEILTIFSILFFALVVFSSNNFDFNYYHNGDVHRGFHRGLDVLSGVNSYESFSNDNMLTQEKVPGFFPLYFYVMSFFVYISDFSFIKFIDNLRIFTFIFYCTIGLLIYFNLRKVNFFFAVFGVLVFMFNRWTVQNVVSLKQESYVLLLLLSSLLLIKSNKYLAFFLFGFATGIKHLTIIIFPILLFYSYKDYLVDKSKKFVQTFLLQIILFISPIAIPSVSYFNDNPEKFINSIFFNVTREPESEFVSDFTVGLDRTLVLYNQDLMSNFLLFLPRLPLILMLIFVNIFLFKDYINKWEYCFLSYYVFTAFNPVLFSQYMVWYMLFLPFILPRLFKFLK